MSRLFATNGFYELWKCSHLVASCVAKRKAISLLPVSTACHPKLHLFGRHLNTGSPVWKDALPQTENSKSEEMDQIDLEKWKSVMRSQASSELRVNEEEDASEVDDDENVIEPGGDLEGKSLIEATREMVAMWREAGKLVPQEMTDEQVQILAECITKSSRKKYLKHLAIKESFKKAHKKKQQKRAAEREALMEQRRVQHSEAQGEDAQRAQELKRTFIIQFWDRSLDNFLAWKSAQAMVFGQPLVFDMSYDSNMNRREVENTVSQLMEVEGWNRRAIEPFHLHYCNLQADGAYQKELLKRYGAETWDHLLITSTDSKHVDMFPSDQLVYLTADSRNVLRKFDHSKVYIIGALVDRSIQSGLSLANAKRLKLATARLPLDEFLHWETGAKNLTLDQMIRIMLTIKDTGNWEEALKFVPKRKHDGFYQQKTRTEITNNVVRRVTNQGQRMDVDRTFRSGERSFKNEGQSFHQSHTESGLNKPAAIKVRTSFKSSMEGRKGAGKGKMWWDKE
uniref:tRNA methyltransferase 10 homolog C n=1 Tax=Semicossyphus pulcher TaxID=241346 RepID=UPI0037E8E288